MTDTTRPAGLRDGTPPPPAGTGVRLTAIPAAETTRPDPQVVAWMRGHLRDNPGTSAARTIRAWLDAMGYDTLGDSPRSLRELTGAHRAANTPALPPLADIPAGQGPASLFIERKADGGLSLWFMTAAGFPVNIQRERAYGEDTPNLDAAARALWEKRPGPLASGRGWRDRPKVVRRNACVS